MSFELSIACTDLLVASYKLHQLEPCPEQAAGSPSRNNQHSCTIVLGDHKQML